MNRFIFILILMLAIKAEAQTSALAVSDSLYAVGEYAEAINKLQKIAPKTDKIYLKLAKNYVANRQPEVALESYKKVLDKNPERVLTAVEYGELLMKTGKLEAADSLFENLTEDYPKNANFKFQHGLIKEKLKDSSAIHYFMYTTILDTTHQGALYKLAKDKLRNRQYTMAEHYSKQGLEANPNNASLLSILAQTYSSLKLYRKAIPIYEKLLELGQESEFIYTKLGYANYQLFDYKSAIENYKGALEFEDRNSATHFILGKLYAQTGDLEKSEKHLLMAILIKKQPVDAEFLSLGLTYKLQKKYKDALEYFDKALEENPDNQRALYEKAVAADNYYEDRELVLQHYDNYLQKYQDTGNMGMLSLAKNRIRDINKKLHLEEASKN